MTSLVSLERVGPSRRITCCLLSNTEPVRSQIAAIKATVHTFDGGQGRLVDRVAGARGDRDRILVH